MLDKSLASLTLSLNWLTKAVWHYLQIRSEALGLKNVIFVMLKGVLEQSSPFKLDKTLQHLCHHLR